MFFVDIYHVCEFNLWITMFSYVGFMSEDPGRLSIYPQIFDQGVGRLSL